MLITDEFVYIHLPKTGGTFVRTVIQEYFETRHDLIVLKRYDENNNLKKLKVLSGTWRQRLLNQDFGKQPKLTILMIGKGNGAIHTHCSQIPKEHQHKPIISCIRNPYDRLVSGYEFNDWQIDQGWVGKIGSEKENLLKQYPSYPKLTFNEFYEMLQTYHPLANRARRFTALPLGILSLQFLDFFSKYGFDEILPHLTPRYVHSDAFKQQMSTVSFLDMYQLNEELYKFLLRSGYPSHQIEFIRTRGKILPGNRGRNESQKWEQYYTPAMKQHIREMEWILFELFPEFDI